MTKLKIPCIDYQKQTNNSECMDCKIGKKGLCNVFIKFIKSKLIVPKPDNYDAEILEKTVESIFKRFDKFRGNENFIEGAFYLFCDQEFSNRKCDIFRVKKNNFENKKIIFESQLSGDSKDKEKTNPFENGWIIEYLGQKHNNIPFTFQNNSETHAFSSTLFNQMQDKLKTMSEEGDKCGELVLNFYKFLKNGDSKRDMAKKLNLNESTFKKDLGRCFKKISAELDY